MKGYARISLLVGLALAAAAGASYGSDPRDILFHYEWVGDIDRIGFNEPSGIVYHTGRDSLFVVGDEGDICELATDGSSTKQAHVRDADFEGVTFDPATGLLYVAIEGEERVLEIDPESFTVLREFSIDREFEGVTLLRQGGQGIEAIVFVPDLEHAEGGVFYIANQGFESAPPDDPSVIVEVELPLRSGEGRELKGKTNRALHVGVIDIAGLHYDAASGHLYFVSDSANTLFEMTREGELVRSWAFPGDNQEGLAMDEEGFLYIAQDSGGVIKLKWLRDPQASS